jgi:hypothetical protein
MLRVGHDADFQATTLFLFMLMGFHPTGACLIIVIKMVEISPSALKVRGYLYLREYDCKPLEIMFAS